MLQNLLEKVVDLCAEHEIPATFFEIAFIMTCLHFQSMKCDVVVLEVGMGGRFDASNVISSELSVVTSIGMFVSHGNIFYSYPKDISIYTGMDHMNSLGGTLESIARHKAGIFKPNTASLVGPGCPLAVMEVSQSFDTPFYDIIRHVKINILLDLFMLPRKNLELQVQVCKLFIPI